MSEYLDKNRHEVQEQDLQEQLRLQALASPGDEKEAGIVPIIQTMLYLYLIIIYIYIYTILYTAYILYNVFFLN